MSREPEYIFFPKKTYRWPTDTWKAAQYHKHHGNANQNHSEIPPYICQKDYYQKYKKYTVGGNVNWYSRYGRWYRDSLKN